MIRYIVGKIAKCENCNKFFTYEREDEKIMYTYDKKGKGYYQKYVICDKCLNDIDVD